RERALPPAQPHPRLKLAEDARERDEREVAGEELPRPRRLVPGRELPVAPREPRLREPEREEEQSRRDDPARARRERDERDEPDQVLRREDLVEGDEGDDSRGGGEERRLPIARAAPGVRDPNREDGHHLGGGGEVGGEPGAASTQRLSAVRGHGREWTHPEVLRRHEDRRAEALDLQRPVELPADARPETVRG